MLLLPGKHPSTYHIGHTCRLDTFATRALFLSGLSRDGLVLCSRSRRARVHACLLSAAAVLLALQLNGGTLYTTTMCMLLAGKIIWDENHLCSVAKRRYTDDSLLLIRFLREHSLVIYIYMHTSSGYTTGAIVFTGTSLCRTTCYYSSPPKCNFSHRPLITPRRSTS